MIDEADKFKEIIEITELTKKINDLENLGATLDEYAEYKNKRSKLAKRYKYSMPFLTKTSIYKIKPLSTNRESSILKIFDNVYKDRILIDHIKSYKLAGILALFSKKLIKSETIKLYILSNTNVNKISKAQLVNILNLFPVDLKSQFKKYASYIPGTSDFLVDIWCEGYTKEMIYDNFRNNRRNDIFKFNIFHIYNSDRIFDIEQSYIFTQEPKTQYQIYENIELSSLEPFFRIPFIITNDFKFSKKNKYFIANVKSENLYKRIAVSLDYTIHNNDLFIFNKENDTISPHYLNMFFFDKISKLYDILIKDYIIVNNQIITEKKTLGNIKYIFPLFQKDEILKIDRVMNFDINSLNKIKLSKETILFIKSKGFRDLLSLMFDKQTDIIFDKLSFELAENYIYINSLEIFEDNILDFIEYVLNIKVSKIKISDIL